MKMGSLSSKVSCGSCLMLLFFVSLGLFEVKGDDVSDAVGGWALCGADKAREVESC